MYTTMGSFPLAAYRLIPGVGLGDSLLFLPAAWALAQKGHRVVFHSSWLTPFKDQLPLLHFENTISFSSAPQDIPVFKEEILAIQNDSPAVELIKKAGFDKVQIKKVGSSRFQGFTQGREIFDQLAGNKQTPEEVLHSLRSKLLNPFPLPRARSLAIHPGSQDPLKNWPVEKYLLLAKNLIKNGWKIEVFGSHQEASLLSPFKGLADIHLSLPLDQLLYKLAQSELFVGNDSGLGHLASLAGIPTISLFKSYNHGKLWQPTWSSNIVISPFLPLPGKLRNSLWKSQLYIWQVTRAIEKQSKLFTSQQRSL